MKIRGKKIKQGLKIKGTGLTKKEETILREAIRRIEYGRKKNNMPFLLYHYKLKQVRTHVSRTGN